MPAVHFDIYDEVLRHDVLSDADLARCCLVSKDFATAAHRSLYGELELSFATNVDENLDTLFQQWRPASLKRYEATRPPHLARLVQSLVVSSGLADEQGTPHVAVENIVEDTLAICVNVKTVSLGQENRQAVLPVLASSRQHYRHLRRLPLCDTLWPVLKQQKDLIHLEVDLLSDTLALAELDRSLAGTFASPFRLRTLSIDSLFDRLPQSVFGALIKGSLTTLTRLHMPYDPNLLRAYKIFPNLRELSLTIHHTEVPESTLSGKEAAGQMAITIMLLPPSLESFSLSSMSTNLWGMFAYPTIVELLPAKLKRLELAGKPTVADVEPLFACEKRPPIEVLGYSLLIEEQDDFGRLVGQEPVEVREKLAERGVKLVEARWGAIKSALDSTAWRFPVV
ncbi:hypothetical protein JCM10213_004708 [Rhodosporidiobolus nylandii]